MLFGGIEFILSRIVKYSRRQKAEQTAVYMQAKGDAPPKASLKLNKEAKNERRLHKAVKKDAELGMVFGHQHHKAVCSPDF